MDNEIAKYAVDRFAIRFKNKYKRRPRRWFVSELGPKTSRIHLHGIYFEDTSNEELEKLWKYGNIWVGDYCNRASITYIVKYMTKVDEKHPFYKGIVLTSNGIGRGYEKRGNFGRSKYNKNGKTRDYYSTDNGFKMSNPIYYRNLLYTEDERDELWVEKLDSGKTWVMDVEIDTTVEGWEKYREKVLLDKQKLNKICKFGDGEIDWELRRYRNRS